jgi:hypothetical protein
MNIARHLLQLIFVLSKNDGQSFISIFIGVHERNGHANQK